MKKIFISAVLIVLVTASSFAADANKVTAKVEDNFAFAFKNAKNVSWKTTDNFVKAAFVLDGKNMEVFYDLDGNMIATTSSIAIEDLPTRAKRSFAKKYGEYTVREAIKFDGVEDTDYYISAEKESESLLIKVSPGGFVSIVKKEKK